jgi:hypothetical protein
MRYRRRREIVERWQNGRIADFRCTCSVNLGFIESDVETRGSLVGSGRSAGKRERLYLCVGRDFLKLHLKTATRTLQRYGKALFGNNLKERTQNGEM